MRTAGEEDLDVAGTMAECRGKAGVVEDSGVIRSGVGAWEIGAAGIFSRVGTALGEILGGGIRLPGVTPSHAILAVGIHFRVGTGSRTTGERVRRGSADSTLCVAVGTLATGDLAIRSSIIARRMQRISIGRRTAIFGAADSGVGRLQDHHRRASALINRRANRGAAREVHLGSVGSAAGVRKEFLEAKAGADSVRMAAAMRRKGSEAEGISVVGIRAAGTRMVAGIRAVTADIGGSEL